MYKVKKIEADIRERLPLVAAYFKDRPEVIVAYLFGSYARDGEDALSDVDIAVLLDDLAKEEIWHLELEMADRVCDFLQTSEVDLVVLNTAPLVARFDVISTGKVLQSNDEEKRTDFEVAVMTEYWDFKKYDEEYDQYFLRRLKENLTDVERQEYQTALRKAGRMPQPVEGAATVLAR